MKIQYTDRLLPVAVTGLGAVTPYGHNTDMFWKAITAGKHAFVPIQLFHVHEHRTGVAAEIRDLPSQEFRRVDRNTLSRCDLLALSAAFEALRHSRLLDESKGCVLSPQRIGVIVGTAAGGILGVERFFRNRAARQHIASSIPLLSSFCLSSVATNIAREFVMEGPRMTIATVCSSSGLALAAANELLETEDIDAVLVVGAETLSEVSHAGFNSLRSIAPERCQPFDLNRKGLILGEGAGAMVIERTDAARQRNIPVLAFLRGYGLTTDVHHFTAPQPEGQAIADTIVQAMDRAAVGPERITYVNAHGTGTKLNDIAETRGLRKALGPRADDAIVSSTKSMIGHQMGAASILEGIATVMSIKSGVIHPTANLDAPDPDCDLDYASDGAHTREVDCALANSFAFGGSNISLIFSKDSGKGGMPAPSDSGPEVNPVVTGIGIVSPIGIGKNAFLHALDKGKSGMRSLESVGVEWSSFRGATVDMTAVHDKTSLAIRRRLNRQATFLFVSFKEAMEDSGIGTENGWTPSIVYGSAYGCSGNVHRFYSQLLKDGPKFVSPIEFNMSVTNAPPSLIAHQFGLKGPIWVFVADEASWDLSLHWGARLVRTAKADQVVVCAAEEIDESVLAIHHELGFLETKEQKGLLLGEGAVCMVIEPESAALERGVRIYGAITGWHSSQDSSCGPLDYSSDAGHLIKAATRCAQKIDDKRGDLLCISPENGITALEHIASETVSALHRLWGEDVSKVGFRSTFGESGMAGGLGLAGALLDQNPASASNIMVLTSARGGINAVSLIQRK